MPFCCQHHGGTWQQEWPNTLQVWEKTENPANIQSTPPPFGVRSPHPAVYILLAQGASVDSRSAKPGASQEASLDLRPWQCHSYRKKPQTTGTGNMSGSGRWVQGPHQRSGHTTTLKLVIDRGPSRTTGARMGWFHSKEGAHSRSTVRNPNPH